MSILKLNLIVVTLVLTLTAGFVLVLLIPGLETLEQRREALDKEIAEVQGKQQMVGNVSDLYASILKMDEEMSDFRKRLPAERRFGEFVNDVCESLMDRGINDYFPQQKPARYLDGTKLPDQLKRARNTVILPVSFSFETDFNTLFEFLKCIDSLPRLSHVESMQVVNEETQPGRISVEMVLHTYNNPD